MTIGIPHIKSELPDDVGVVLVTFRVRLLRGLVLALDPTPLGDVLSAAKDDGERVLLHVLLPLHAKRSKDLALPGRDREAVLVARRALLAPGLAETS